MAPPPMRYSQPNLIRLLEYRNFPPSEAYAAMAASLGLEFYSEPASQVYSICSDSFVVDITPDGCNLLFVDESHASDYHVVSKYLTSHLDRPVLFYRLLRYFAVLTDLRRDSAAAGTPETPIAEPAARLEKSKYLCECVLTNEYCIRSPFTEIPGGYNIYTHRVEYTQYDPLLCMELRNGVPQLDRNLARYFGPHEYSARLLDRVASKHPGGAAQKGAPELDTPPETGASSVPDRPIQKSGSGTGASPSDGFYYEADGIRVDGRRNLLIDGERDPLGSFLFKSGLSLADALRGFHQQYKV